MDIQIHILEHLYNEFISFTKKLVNRPNCGEANPTLNYDNSAAGMTCAKDANTERKEAVLLYFPV